MVKMVVIEFEEEEFAIELENDEKTNVEAGELVICETKDGYVTVGRTVTESFYTADAENFSKNYGRQIANTDLIGVYKCDLWKRDKEKQ